MTTTRSHSETPPRVTRSELADLLTIDVWNMTEPSFAGVVGASRSHVYAMAKAGAIPGLIRLGTRRMAVSVPALLAWLDGEAEADRLTTTQMPTRETAGQELAATSPHVATPGALTSRGA